MSGKQRACSRTARCLALVLARLVPEPTPSPAPLPAHSAPPALLQYISKHLQEGEAGFGTFVEPEAAAAQ